MRNLDMSLVFKLTSIEDLGMLTAALKQVKTLQEMIKLERDVKTLTRQKKLLENELAGIKKEIHTLCPERLIKSDEKKDTEPEPSADEAESVEEEEEGDLRVEEAVEEAPSSLIEERTDGAQQEEEETIV